MAPKIPRNASAEPEKFRNFEIVTLAVYMLGGSTRPIDTEDVAIKSNELAPGRFAWRKYKEQINLELVRIRLQDACKAEKGAYLVGSTRTGWILTERGASFARRASKRYKAATSREPLSAAERAWRRRERARLLAALPAAWDPTLGAPALIRGTAEDFFRLDAYVSPEARERKIARIVNAFGSDPRLGAAVRAMARRVRENA